MVVRRLHFLAVLTALSFTAVWGRLVHLQVVTHDFWVAEALKSRTGGRPVPFARGDILDRYGRPLAEGEVVHRLEFVFHRFRRETPMGLLLGSCRRLLEAGGGSRCSIAAVAADPETWVRFLLARPAREVWEAPRARRDDLVFYLRRLLELPESEVRRRLSALAEQGRPCSELAPAAVAEITNRVRRQAAALEDLARALGIEPDEWIARLDGVLEEIDRRVASDLAAVPGASAKRRRAVRRDHESRPRILVASVGFRVVYLVNLVPERYGGFFVEDVERRRYPEETRDTAPLLVGRVGAPSPELLAARKRDEREYLRLTSLKSSEVDVLTAERIDTLRKRLRHEDVRPDEEVGISGLEAVLEPVLRGRRGWRVEELDGDRRVRRVIELVPPLDGLDVRLTLDVDLQRAAERVLDRHVERGALVLLDPRRGDILALATAPRPTRKELREDWGRLVARADHPLHHRAFRPPGNPPPPGSVFKIVVAAAALERGALSPRERIECAGVLRAAGTTFQCYHRRPHGSLDVVDALARSCNIFFYEVGRRVGLDAMLSEARAVGFGEPTGFADPVRLGLPEGGRRIGEAACPLQRGRGLAFTLRTAIGHAALDDVTPLQVAGMAAVVANGGVRAPPRLIVEIGGSPVPPPEPRPVGWSPATVEVLRRGMIAAVERGTARPKGGDDLRVWKVAAKTGTPQAIEAGRYVEHAWMAGFLPHDAPRLAFSIFVEDSEVGGGGATRPVLADLLRQPELVRFLESEGGL